MNLFGQRKTNFVPLDPGIKAVLDQQGGTCQIVLSGRITIDSSPGLRALLIQRLLSPACHRLTVDFRDVAYVDTSGLAILVEVLKAARSEGKTFQLDGLQERPRYLLETTRLLKLFDAVNDDTPGAKSSQIEMRS